MRAHIFKLLAAVAASMPSDTRLPALGSQADNPHQHGHSQLRPKRRRHLKKRKARRAIEKATRRRNR